MATYHNCIICYFTVSYVFYTYVHVGYISADVQSRYYAESMNQLSCRIVLLTNICFTI